MDRSCLCFSFALLASLCCIFVVQLLVGRVAKCRGWVRFQSVWPCVGVSFVSYGVSCVCRRRCCLLIVGCFLRKRCRLA